MNVHGGVEQAAVAPTLPRSIWVLAWASLAGQVLLVIRHGGRVGEEQSQILSMVLSAILVGYVSAGVVRARGLRVVLAWVVLTSGVVGGLVDVVAVDDPGQAAHAVFALVALAVSLVALAKFCGSDWYAWQQTRPPSREGASIGGLVVIGVLVGVLGGYVGMVDTGVTTRVNVNVG